MAATFTLPDELFDSMIHYFGHNKEPKDNLLPGKEEKNKINDDGPTTLTSKQKNRVKVVGDMFFSVNKVQTLFEKDFAKHIEKIEEYEAAENIKQIVEFESEKIKVKDKKKKRSWRSSVRKMRMLIRFYTFFKSVYENFKKFQEHAQEIINRNNGENDVTLREALTDKDARKKFIKKYKKIFNETITAFFEDVIMGSVIPAIELIIRMLVDAILELFKNIKQSFERLKSVLGDGLEVFFKTKGFKISAKVLTKILGR